MLPIASCAGRWSGRDAAVSGWVVGDVAPAERGDAGVALTLLELRAASRQGRRAVSFHELLGGEVHRPAPARHVLVAPPTWRGYAFAELLEWMVCARLGEPGTSTATWRSPAKGGATGVRRMLERRGWQLEVSKRKRQVWMRGRVPEAGTMPQPATLAASLGGADLTFAVGWGVFAGKRVDEGTSLLFEVALDYAPVPRVADIGTGYGALATALVAGGHAARAVASDVDAVALHLARRNAEAAGAQVELLLDDDPRGCPETPLTVCNVPTHSERGNAALLVDGLSARTSAGPVLVVVHASLEGRYTAWFRRAGAAVRTVRRAGHAVLELTRGGPARGGGER